MKNAATIFSENFLYLAKLLKVNVDEAKDSRLTILGNMIAKLEAVPYIQFPVSFSTVDMIPVYIDGKGEKWVMLGFKWNQDIAQFLGGFRDPRETSAEAAAREFWEEGQNKKSPQLHTSRFKFIGELFIDDSRYADSPHKITTQIFKVNISFKEKKILEGGDDIREVSFFKLKDLKADPERFIRPVHLKLFDYVKDKI